MKVCGCSVKRCIPDIVMGNDMGDMPSYLHILNMTAVYIYIYM